MTGGEFGLDHKTSMEWGGGVLIAFGLIQVIMGTVIVYPGLINPLVNREDDPNTFWSFIAIWVGMGIFVILNAA